MRKSEHAGWANVSSNGPPGQLLVIIPDQLTQIVEKGELQPRYYNPGNLFQDVAILMTNGDRPPIEPLRYLVGDANLTLHNHPDDLTLPQQRWQRWWHRPLRQWAEPGVAMARALAPSLIRCHGADWNVYLAHRIKQALHVPYVVSLHINADVNPPRRYRGDNLSDEQRRHNDFYEHVERTGLRDADLVMPVYRPIVPYLERLGVERYEVCYNVLNANHLRQKTSYIAGRPFRIACVGRLIAEKNPENLIRAVGQLENVTLMIVGDGADRQRLEELVRGLHLTDRVQFLSAVANDELCAMLPAFDMFAVHTEYWELNKSVLEALLTGLPLVINHRVTGPPVPELEGADFVRFVDNTVAGYAGAIRQLMTDDGAREALGRRAYQHAQANWAPAITEAKVVDIYRRLAKA